MFSVGIEVEHWPEIGLKNVANMFQLNSSFELWVKSYFITYLKLIERICNMRMSTHLFTFLEVKDW